MTNSNCTCKLFLGLDLTSCIQAADDSNGTDSPAEHSALSEIVSLVLDSRLKISLGKKSLQQIQAKSSDFILNPEMYVYRREKYIYCLLEESTCFPFFKVKSISLIFCCFFSYMYYIQSWCRLARFFGTRDWSWATKLSPTVVCNVAGVKINEIITEAHACKSVLPLLDCLITK